MHNSRWLTSIAMVLMVMAPGFFAGAQAQGPDSDPLWRKFMQDRYTGNKPAAIEDLNQGVAKGDANAEAQLAEEYRGGDFELAGAVKIDYRKSFELTKRAVDQGSVRAMTDLGVLYLRGQGEDYRLALTYFIKATDSGDRKAPRYAGIIYENGYGTPADYGKAAEYYQNAEKTGDITGTCLLGSLYERGLGVAKNYDRAAALYLKSAERGDQVASGGMVALGNLYETRTDGKNNSQTAILWYRKAADQDNAAARAGLERLTGDHPEPAAAGQNWCLSPFPR